MTELAEIHVPEGTDVTLMARVQTRTGTYPAQTDNDSYTAHLFDLSGADPTADPLNATLVEATVYPSATGTPTTSGAWVTDTTGYNFIYTLPGANIAEGGRTYRLEIVIDSSNVAGGGTDSGQIAFAALIHALPLLVQ